VTGNDEQGARESRAQVGNVGACVRSAISFGGLAPGETVTVGALVDRHRVSAAAAQRALVQLEDEGLLGRRADGSFRVRDSARPAMDA